MEIKQDYVKDELGGKIMIEFCALLVFYIEVIRPILNIFFFLRKEFTHKKKQKKTQKAQKHT